MGKYLITSIQVKGPNIGIVLSDSVDAFALWGDYATVKAMTKPQIKSFLIASVNTRKQQLVDQLAIEGLNELKAQDPEVTKFIGVEIA